MRFTQSVLIFLLTLISTVHHVRARSQPVQMGDLANCDCNCPCNKITSEPKRCDIDLIILVNAAACTKDYHTQMKIQIEKIAEKAYTQVNDYNLRIGVLTYSETVKTIVSIKDDHHSSKDIYNKIMDTHRGWTKSMHGRGDFLSVGLKGVYNEFDFNSLSRKVLMVVTNSGDSRKDGKLIKEQTRRLRAAAVEMFVHTITPFCVTPKDCLMCCPDMHFLTSYIATSDKVCSNKPEYKFRSNNEDGRPFDKSEIYYGNPCIEQMSYQCKGQERAEEECKKECTCTCKSVRPGKPGIKGIPGEPGDIGKPGNPGGPGAPGKTGYPGMPGAPGNPGQAGKKCVDGKPAPPGRQGKHGSPANDGPTGEAGRPGDNGPDGPPGGFGPKGQPGPQGATGSQGPRGRPGPPGPHGGPGPKGKPGCAGDDGLAGAVGRDGEDGAAGARGAAGPQGYPGVAGAPGLNGKSGEDGPVGAPGRAGIQGPAGIDGRQGAPGMKGKTGEQGLKGISIKFEYSRYARMVEMEIESYLESFGWKFNCDCHRDDPLCHA